ncbi:hypothetical protein CYLTODRAFT_357364 [Cylindrobasidium torrendii FP15055 ss-10]|uniref:Uncharacterized protein n=1 Tax=Cylindrobasidium torrendii FP15055 ss-10 TaxID=1314674 RepID=A0A0D7B6E2_9AGAR|nr:hypothetical protein CYLTODRAFT_357364 [Cylindrobasidium torrendii FP15055 ss-10]
MTRAFAKASGNACETYYAEDSVGSAQNRIILKGQNALEAWATPQKSMANDLPGRLPLTIGMPVIVTDNVLVKKGVSNGSRGTLAGVKYYERSGKRYASSVDVILPNYRGDNKLGE